MQRQGGTKWSPYYSSAPSPPPQVDETSEAESCYDRLLARVGAAISIHPQLVKIVSYIVLFSSDFTGVNSRQRSRVETVQVGGHKEL